MVSSKVSRGTEWARRSTEASVGVAKHEHAFFFHSEMAYGGKSYSEHP